MFEKPCVFLFLTHFDRRLTEMKFASSTPARSRSIAAHASKPRNSAADKQPASVEYGRGWFDATRRAAETTTGRGAAAEIGE